MLLPQYSIKKILLFTGLFAVWCWVAIQAWHGAMIAQAILFAFMAWAAWLTIHLAITGTGFLMMKLSELTRREQPQSPFAHETKAPQILPPQDIPLD
ncbi:MAG: hypothetical protein WD045_04150 [Pirellulaceae bacterium]